MLCKVCMKKVRTRRSFHRLFEPEIHHICESCYQKYPLLPRYEVIPIEQSVMHLHVMSKRKYPHDPLAYMSFVSSYVKLHQKHHPHEILIMLDLLDDSILTLLDTLKLGNLFVVTLYENIEEKGEKR